MTDKWLSGIEVMHGIQRAKTSKHHMLTYGKLIDAKVDFAMKRCGADFRIVQIEEPVVLKEFQFDRRHGYDTDLLEWEEDE